MACEVFKIVNNIAPTFIVQNLIMLKCFQYFLRNNKTAVVPKANTSKYGLKSVMHDVRRIWNSLAKELRKTVNYGEFRRLIWNWDGPSCNCCICRLTCLPPYQFNEHVYIIFIVYMHYNALTLNILYVSLMFLCLIPLHLFSRK